MNGHDSIILAAGSNGVTSALDLFSQFAIIGGGLWAVYAARDLHKDGAVITAKGDKLAGSGFDSEKFGGDLFTLDYKDGTAVITARTRTARSCPPTWSTRTTGPRISSASASRPPAASRTGSPSTSTTRASNPTSCGPARRT